MNITISGKNLKVTQPIRDYFEEKLHKLDRYLAGMDPVRIDAEVHGSNKSKGQPRFTAEITLSVPNIVLRAEEVKPDMYEAIDLVQENMERKIRDYKNRFLRMRKKAKRDESVGVGAIETKNLKKIIRRKKFDLGSPISEDEAITRMELLGHDFYLYIDKLTKKQNTVYRRHNGGYGVIQGK